MAFEKMTAEELFHKFWDMYGRTWPFLQIKVYNKIGARMLRIEMTDGHVLYFLWYDENNWNLGTKPYRKRPVKQQMYKALKECNTFEELKMHIEQLPEDMITQGYEMITGCNQIHSDPPGALGKSGVEPIDWVKEDPEVIMASYPPSAE